MLHRQPRFTPEEFHERGQAILPFVFLSVALLGILGCSPGVDPILGKWVNDRGWTMEFHEDGRVVIVAELGKSMTGSWEPSADRYLIFRDDGHPLGPAVVEGDTLEYTNPWRRVQTLERVE